MLNQRKIGVLLSYMTECIKILSGILYTPIMLRLLGQSEYGLYQLVYSVISYLSLLSLGFSSSYMRFYSRLKIKQDEKEIARLNGMFMIIFLIIAVICVLCGRIMINNIEFIFAEGLNAEEYKVARVLMALMVVNLALTFPNSVFNCFISACEEFIFQKMLSMFHQLFNPFITLPLLLMGHGSIAMVSVTTGLTLAQLIVNTAFCLKKLKVKFIFGGFNFKLLREMWAFTFYIFINMIVDQINWSIDKFLLGRFASTVAVAIYGVGGQLNTMYLQFSTAVSNVFIPKVNCIVAENNDNKQLTDLLIKVGRVQFIILSLILTGFVFFGKQFILVWAGMKYESSYRIALFLMVPVTVPLVQNLGIEIQRAKNMHKARAIAYLCIAVSNIFVSIPCIKIWGAQGAAIGTALTLLLGNGLFMNWYYYKRMDLDVIYFWKQIVRIIPSLIVPILVGGIMKYFLFINGIISLIICSSIYIVVFCLSIYFWGMNKDEQSIFNELLTKIKDRL